MIQIPKPTVSIIDTAPEDKAVKYTFGTRAAVLVDRPKNRVVIGWRSPAGHDDDPLSRTGGLLPPDMDSNYNEAAIPFGDRAAVEAKARQIGISLEMEVETEEYRAAVEAAEREKKEEAARAKKRMDEFNAPRAGMKHLWISWAASHAHHDAECARLHEIWKKVEPEYAAGGLPAVSELDIGYRIDRLLRTSGGMIIEEREMKDSGKKWAETLYYQE